MKLLLIESSFLLSVLERSKVLFELRLENCQITGMMLKTTDYLSKIKNEIDVYCSLTLLHG